MPRRGRSTQTCQQHEFALFPRHSHLLHAQHLSASYCSGKEPFKRPSRSEKPRQCFDGPTFNQDYNFGSPAFILPSEMEYYTRRGEGIMSEHYHKFRNFTDEKTQMVPIEPTQNVPKPRSKNNYCSVCKLSYEDYMSHIETSYHKRKIRCCLFNTYILELTNQFEQTHKGRNGINRDHSTVVEVSDDEDEVEIISNPTKKQKIEEALLSYGPPSLRPLPSTNLSGLNSQQRQVQAQQKQQQQMNLNICMNMNLISFSNYPPLYPHPPPPPPSFYSAPYPHLHPYFYYPPQPPLPPDNVKPANPPECIVIDD